VFFEESVGGFFVEIGHYAFGMDGCFVVVVVCLSVNMQSGKRT